MLRGCDMQDSRKGTRCTVCTGCGRCPGVPYGVQTVTQRLTHPQLSLKNTEGYRLVTIDIGTTTIALQLHDAKGNVVDSLPCVNPQFSYGADVISRIHAAEEPAKLADLQEQVRAVIEKGLARFQKKIEGGEKLLGVLAANTTMIYLFMGWDPRELGHAPFAATKLSAFWTKASDVPIYVLPGISAFVGADIAAGILASGMLRAERPTLLVDLGTNGEMALGCQGRLVTCATAAGPAFEGGANRGAWGADMVSLLARLLDEGMLDASGLLAEPYFTEGIRIGDVLLTQASVRNVQLAKAAIAAGIEILCEKFAIDVDEIERVVLAGGFGYYLDPVAAGRIGLLPEALVGRTVTGGNTALLGALLAGERALSKGVREGDFAAFAAGFGVPQVQVMPINLASEPAFLGLYLEKMNF